MRSKQLPLFLLVLLFLSTYSHAQNWSGILSSSRAIDWSQAGAGTIPTRTTLCKTESPGVSLATLNSDISSCPSGDVVFLSAGTYTFAGQITMKSNVTLRGAGADQTTVRWTASGSCQGNGGDICIWNGDSGNPNYGATNQASWTGAYAQGATSITLGTVSKGSIGNLTAGSLLILDQNDQPSDPGTIWNCESTGTTADCSQQGGQNGAPGASQTQTVTVTSISGSGPWAVGISPGLYSPIWSSSYSPQAYWANFAPITGVGIENMTLDASAETDSPGTSGSLIFFGWATNCWVTGVRTLNTGSPPYRNNIWLYSSTHLTLQNNYIYGSDGYDLSYGIESGFETSDNLVANNIFQHVATPEICNGCQGVAWLYNYAADNYYTAEGSAPNFQQVASYGGHSNGSYLDLFEGNVGGKASGDDIHGTNWMITGFRNYWPGRDGPFKTSSTMAIDIESYDRYYNFIANVLGEPGWQTTYKDVPASQTDNTGCNTVGPRSIYTLGWAGGNGCSFSIVFDDTKVSPSMMLWGNYDTVNAATQWNTSEVPSDLSSYANPVPTTTCTSSLSCPNSFYYNSQPAFWATAYGTPPWPAIGPDVGGGPGPGGHAYQIPAQLCFNNAAYDTNYAVQATIASISESGTTATMTLSASAPASFTQYQSFWITGSSVAGYNGLQQVATVSGSMITFTAASGLGSASGGTATVDAIHVFDANTCYPPSDNSTLEPPTGLSAVVQ
jgi:Pectate lyase superfamily protein